MCQVGYLRIISRVLFGFFNALTYDKYYRKPVGISTHSHTLELVLSDNNGQTKVQMGHP